MAFTSSFSFELSFADAPPAHPIFITSLGALSLVDFYVESGEELLRSFDTKSLALCTPFTASEDALNGVKLKTFRSLLREHRQQGTVSSLKTQRFMVLREPPKTWASKSAQTHLTLSETMLSKRQVRHGRIQTGGLNGKACDLPKMRGRAGKEATVKRYKAKGQKRKRGGGAKSRRKPRGGSWFNLSAIWDALWMA
ncbi:hypothetical protein PsYK624_167910 [Phanerochaete sordida]|uniref:Uncharacterized protein n=1 Tax=Phanerochaete sordida TaxID=48140 RepID=A0A9P3GT52_9APHY|nr:hypothetical protein PsYK624_167910 [Phanerochaete sordida]